MYEFSELSVSGFASPFIVYAALLILHRLLPAQVVRGYVDDPVTGQPYSYRLNGLFVLVVTVVLWAGLCRIGWLPWDWLYLHRWSALTGACVLGLAYTLQVVLTAPPTGRGLLLDLFLGRHDNIQYFSGSVDAKMFLYLAGAVMLVLNALSFAAFHHLAFGEAANPGVYLHTALLIFFVLDYFTFERVHLYTYDLFAEKVGFKLGWGCLVYYPYFYVIGLWGTAHLPASNLLADNTTLWLTLSALVFFSGWMIARGANMQKYFYKRFPEHIFLGRFKPVTIKQGNQQLLCSGFWGVARHINYLGEILMALGIALSLGHLDSPWPWLYPLYYLALLLPRERDDDARCAAKYGTLWEEYRQRVPARVIPKIY